MTTTENIRTDGWERPFKDLKNIRPIGWQEIANDLQVLHLSEESTNDEVRRTAISLRSRLQGVGLNGKELKALRFVLERTNDCINDHQFLSFLLEDVSFEQIQSATR